MATDGNNLIWDIQGGAGDPQFAKRINLENAEGFFSKGLVIEPGTHGLVIEDGVFRGVVPPGAYELQSFAERLEFWSRKQSTVILTRMEDQRLTETFPAADTSSDEMGFPTTENLFVEVSLELTVQLEDPISFLHNYMGGHDAVTVEQLRKDVRPLLRQALWSAIGQHSIRELGAPDVADQLTESIDEVLKASFDRYGLQFVEIQAVSIRHRKFDDQRQQQGAIWLKGQALEQQQQLDDLYTAEELQRIKNFERDNEIEVLAYEVESDKGESVVASKKRRIAILDEIRQVTQQGQMERLTSRDEMKRFLLDRDKAKVLREEEWDEVLEAYSQNQQDRDLARQHALQTLDLKRSQEIYELQAQLQHQRRLDQLDHQFEIAHRTKSTSNEEHELALQELRQQAAHDHEKRTTELKSHWENIRFENQQKRDDGWKQQVYELEVERIHWESDQRKLDAEAERRGRDQESQIDRLQRLREMNEERRSRRRREQHEIDQERRLTQDQMSTEALVVDADPENAKLLAEMKMHEATTEADKARADVHDKDEMYERLLETQKESTQVIQDTSQKVIDSLTGTDRSPAVPPPPPGAATNTPAGCTWLVSVNGQQQGDAVSLATLQEWARTGQLSPDADLWEPSLGEWTKAAQVTELASHFPPPPPPPPQ